MDIYEKLQKIEANIYNLSVSIKALWVNPSPYYQAFDKQEELKHVIEIKQKSLAYWKRRFNRELQTIKKY